MVGMRVYCADGHPEATIQPDVDESVEYARTRWRCPTCRFDLVFRDETSAPLFARLEAAGLDAVALQMLGQATGRQ